MRTLALFLLLALTAACSSMVRGSLNVAHISPIDEADRQLVVLTPTPYIGELAAELGPYGFRVRPQYRPGESEAAAATTTAAVVDGARYGIQIEQKLESECAFTSSSIYAFVFTIVDIELNEVVMVVRQTGADGACTTVKPVWPSVAKAIADNWNGEVVKQPQ